ncbi:MAG: cell division control protein Cdc6 [Promethearchaeota archaeon Loki_b32]|nr:MAG: cell division control protein Cdc6 [Candidatus Lokiarchaeota archaeon Loki_b32]
MLKNNNSYQFNIDKFYKNYLKGPRIFNNRDALESSYIPDDLPHRDSQIKSIAEKTACALLGDTPPSFLCYGMTGTGKTATIRYVSQKLAQQNSEIKPWWIYINCNIVSTPYRILAHIYNTISRKEKIPPTGLPKDIIFKRLLGLLDSKIGNSICFLVLDEIDILVGKKGGNEILYDLTRLNENLDNCKSSIIGISNKLKFRENLDPRILSSLGEEHIVFPSYDASELRDILIKRAKIAYQENILKEEVIPLCAALAAKNHGDARKALQLLRKAGELAERGQNIIVTAKHVEKAQEELENDHIKEYIKGMPLQAQLILASIYLISRFSPEHIIISGDIYDVHSEIRGLIPGIRELTKRRISDYINELSLAGIISAEVKSMGHYGRTKIIKLDVAMELIGNVILEINKFQGIMNYKPAFLQADKVKLKNNIFKKLI